MDNYVFLKFKLKDQQFFHLLSLRTFYIDIYLHEESSVFINEYTSLSLLIKSAQKMLLRMRPK